MVELITKLESITQPKLSVAVTEYGPAKTFVKSSVPIGPGVQL